MPVAMRRPGFPEIRPYENRKLRMEQGFLVGTADQLAIRRMWFVLCRRIAVVDVHPETFSFQHGISHDKPELCIRDVRRHSFFQRNSIGFPLVGSPVDNGRMPVGRKMK